MGSSISTSTAKYRVYGRTQWRSRRRETGWQRETLGPIETTDKTYRIPATVVSCLRLAKETEKSIYDPS